VSTAITHLLAKDTLLRNTSIRLFDAGFAIVLAMLCIALLAWRRNAVGLIAIVAVVALWAVINTVAYAHGIWMSAALPLAAAVPPAMAFGALQIWSSRRSVQHFAARSDLLRQFQAPGLRDWLIKDPDYLLQPVHQHAAVIFIDISRFTALSETRDADAVRELLKSFHAMIDQVTLAHGGVVTTFMGDGAMILFGLPVVADDDAARAVRCCIELTTRTGTWIAGLPPEIASQIGFKIGAHFGDIVASRLGGASYQHITATGDTVNVASRLMEVAASHGAKVALSDDLLRAAGADCAVRATGALSGPTEVQIRGRSGAVSAWLWHDGSAAEAISTSA
jgi:adenylate cyclase